MANVTLKNIKKVYDKNVVAVQEFSLEIADKEFIVLVGPSGCGKSTTLRMIAGLEEITEGELYIGDRLVNDVAPKDRDIAMVFQNYALYPHMTVYNNMAYGLRNRGMPKPEIEQRVREAARILEIEALLERKPRQLSGGQRQRVAMGRAIVRQPKVFLFDEPLSNLDAKLRIAMRVEIRKLQRRLATTSIYVTHDQLEAMTLADMLVVMNGGVVEQIGRPLDVYHQPATTFVASFIGAPPMNLIALDGSELRRQIGAGQDAATLGIRPEDLTLMAGDPGDGGIRMQLQVDAVERVGPESFVYGHPDDHQGGGEIIVRVPGEHTPALGASVQALAPRDKLHLFGRDGRRRAA